MKPPTVFACPRRRPSGRRSPSLRQRRFLRHRRTPPRADGRRFRSLSVHGMLAATARHDGMRGPFAVALDAEEIEEDVYALTGARPRRRPRKRARVVQRQLDSLFPGLWLTEITADAYRVPDDQ